MPEELSIQTPHGPVTGLVHQTQVPRAIVVIGHGAGVDMRAPILQGFSEGLEASGMASLRFNFLYTEQGRKAPDREPVLRDVYRSAFDAAMERFSGKPAYAGGKSLGGRIASLLLADGEIDAEGLVFIGYPLHPPGKFDRLRTEHLGRIQRRMLFLQGSRDPFARKDLLEAALKDLGAWARLHLVEGGDHSCITRGADPLETGRLLGGRAARFIQAADR